MTGTTVLSPPHRDEVSIVQSDDGIHPGEACQRPMEEPVTPQPLQLGAFSTPAPRSQRHSVGERLMFCTAKA